jgi:hypothetical protein
LYTNANGEERISDVGTFPDTVHDVFFEGGTIVATTSGSDTVVGRFMLNDWRAGAGDKLYADECDVDWGPDFWILYTTDVFVCPNHLEPPSHFKWFWWQVSRQIKIFKEDAPELYRHLVIEYVAARKYYHNQPDWWPEESPPPGHEDTYIGMAEDIDCPSEVFDLQEKRNLAGYDDMNQIAWQRGWDNSGSHPEYNDYYCGIALADAQMPGESIIPYGAYNVRNDQYLYPQDGWGWKDGELYGLASNGGITVDDADSIVDRSWVLTARKIEASSDPSAEARFTIVKIVAPDGLAQLQEYVDSARAIVTREKESGEIPVICGDTNGDGRIEVGDVIALLNYLFKGYPIETIPCPINRADLNGGGTLDLGDVVTLLGYMFKGLPASCFQCPGIWGPPQP